VAGKLSPEELKKYIFPYRGAFRSEVLAGPGIGEDAAVIDRGGEYVYVSSDPIVGAAEHIGKLLIDININDIAVKGGDPNYIVLTLLVPEKLGLQFIEQTMKDIHERALRYDMAVIGGHTEITNAYEKPVVSATIIGSGKHAYSCSRAKLGDAVLLIGDVALEGAYIIYSTHPEQFADVFTDDEKIELNGFADILCIYPYAQLIREHVLFMHDPTEGGVMGGLAELDALLPGKGIAFSGTISLHPIVKKLTDRIGARAGNLISSGSLLAIVDASLVTVVTEILAANKISCQHIGNIADKSNFTTDTSEELWKFI